MNNVIKKLIITSLSSVLLATSSLSSVYADTFKINFSKVVAYDDGDYKPDGAGEIKFHITVNGKIVYKTNGRISLSDRGNDTKTLNFSHTVNVRNKGSVVVRMSGDEYDKWSRNEKCSGTNIVSRYRLQNQKLDCGESNGELGLNLHYYVKRIK